MKLKDNPLFDMLRISKMIERELDKRTQSQCSMSHSDVKLLMVVGFNENASQQELARALQVSPAAISRHIDKLVHDGYLKRETKKNNRRSSQITLTRKGINAREKAKSHLETILATLLTHSGGISQTTAKNLTRVSQKLGEYTQDSCISKVEQGLQT